jgi:hypothetical protein
MKFNGYIGHLTKFTLPTTVILGLVLGSLVLVTGGAEGSITLDIDLSAVDSIWFVLGTPVLLTSVFLLLSPVSYCVHLLLFDRKAEKPGIDV